MEELYFLRYELVRLSGKYNMVMDMIPVMESMKLNPRHKADQAIYLDIQKNYSKYSDKWLPK